MTTLHDSGGPANPVEIDGVQYPGKTLHDRYVGDLVAAMIQSGTTPPTDQDIARAVGIADRLADAMIANKRRREGV